MGIGSLLIYCLYYGQILDIVGATKNKDPSYNAGWTGVIFYINGVQLTDSSKNLVRNKCFN